MIIKVPKIIGWMQPPLAYFSKIYLEYFINLNKNKFSSNVLLIDEYNLEGIDYKNWYNLVEQIKTLVKVNNINTIIIDATFNPIKLDFKYWEMAPTYLEMQKELSQIIDTYILTGDFLYYYYKNPAVIFFPTFLWLDCKKYIIDTQYNIEYTDKTKGLMSLNSNPHWHRIYLFSLLVQKSWFNTISFTFHSKSHSGSDRKQELKLQDRLNDFAITKILTYEERELAKNYAHVLPCTLDGELNTDKSLWGINDDLWIYKKHAINLVTETSLTDGILLTEKTCKPFMTYQIPIIVGPIGANKFLEDIGLDMFSDYVPWKTWDSETDHKLKIRKIVEFLDQLLSSSSAEKDILTAHQTFHTRLKKNKEYFHSTEFEHVLVEQLRF